MNLSFQIKTFKELPRIRKDGRTLQSTPASGTRAGSDGHKKKRGSKVHMAVEPMGYLLPLRDSFFFPADGELSEALVGRLAFIVWSGTSKDCPRCLRDFT